MANIEARPDIVDKVEKLQKRRLAAASVAGKIMMSQVEKKMIGGKIHERVLATHAKPTHQVRAEVAKRKPQVAPKEVRADGSVIPERTPRNASEADRARAAMAATVRSDAREAALIFESMGVKPTETFDFTGKKGKVEGWRIRIPQTAPDPTKLFTNPDGSPMTHRKVYKRDARGNLIRPAVGVDRYGRTVYRGEPEVERMEPIVKRSVASSVLSESLNKMVIGVDGKLYPVVRDVRTVIPDTPDHTKPQQAAHRKDPKIKRWLRSDALPFPLSGHLEKIVEQPDDTLIRNFYSRDELLQRVMPKHVNPSTPPNTIVQTWRDHLSLFVENVLDARGLNEKSHLPEFDDADEGILVDPDHLPVLRPEASWIEGEVVDDFSLPSGTPELPFRPSGLTQGSQVELPSGYPAPIALPPAPPSLPPAGPSES